MNKQSTLHISQTLETLVDEVMWTTRPSASDYVILEGTKEQIVAFLDKSNAELLVKRHNAALARFLTRGFDDIK